MLITLYKNCILTDSYSEVFDVFHKDSNGKTALERYLASLEHKDITAGDVYVTGSGKIPFTLKSEDGDFYQYNYMRILNEVTGFARYCFIDAIAVVSNTAVVSYVEDVWSNYAETMHMRKSLLTRSRILNYGNWQVPFYAPAMTYEGNEYAKIVPIEDVVAPYNVQVIFQLQLYQLAQQGTISKRQILEYCLRVSSDGMDIPLVKALLIIQDIVVNSSVKQIKIGDETWYGEIYNMLVIPAQFGVLAKFAISPSSIRYDANTEFVLVQPIDQSKKVCKEYTLPNNFKRFKVGTFTSCYDFVENGTQSKVRISAQCGLTDFTIYLEMQNQVFDITNDFKIQIPISVQSADVTQQQTTAKEIAEFNAKMGTARGGLQIAQGINNGINGVAKLAFGAFTGQVGSVIGGASQVSNAPYEVAGGIMNIIASSKQLEIANRSMFVTNKGIQANSNSTLNAVYGLIALEIEPDNETEVQANINNTGYVCNEIVDDILRDITTGTVNKYNVMSFDYVNIYGKFTQRIARVLRDILYGGFKIWYDETAINE